MVETRIKISSVVENQLPEYVRDEFPLVVEFLNQYYLSLDNQSSCLDILQNIDKYIKLDQLTSLVSSTTLSADIDYVDTTITVSSTKGFPEKYGLLKIDDEIITYTQKNNTQFIGCVRGFSGVSNYRSSSPDVLTFSQSQAEIHSQNVSVENLSILFLKEFYKKVKVQFSPGFEDRTLVSGLNENIFVKQSKDFYSSKGTDESFKILFKSLYGEEIEVIKPRDYLIQPSDATYRIDNQLVVEVIQGNAQDLLNTTLYQDETDTISKAYGSISNVETIYRGGKEYYKLSLDYDYNKDVTVTGSIFGTFSIHPKTKLITAASINDNFLDVDSTVGFPNSGSLIANLENGTFLSIAYKSKSLNQFLECSGIIQTISPATDIVTDSYAYGYVGMSTDAASIIKVRVTGVLSDAKISNSSYYFDKDDIIEIETLGKKSKTFRENNWIFNASATYQVKTINRLTSDYSYNVETYNDHNFTIGDTILLTSSGGSVYNTKVLSIQNKSQITIKVENELDGNLKYTIRRILSRVNFKNQSDLNSITANVQNVYVDSLGSAYVASPSLPSYQQPLEKKDRSIVFSASPNGYDLTLNDSTGTPIKHYLYTGDSVFYRSNSPSNKLNILDGIYFVEKIDDYTIRLSYSLSNIYIKKYILLSGSVSNNKFEISNFTSKNLKSQKLIRKISNPVNIEGRIETSSGKTGILVNGVEILNYKSKDTIFYGQLEDIIVTSPGYDYDVINPPTVTITDDTGSGAIGSAEVVGNLDSINIIDGGFDYIEEPVITITGGNGIGARAKAELAPFDHISNFNSESQAQLVNLTNNTIGFSSYHKFRDGEKVVYKTYGQTPVSGLLSDATYYVAVKDAFTVKVHKTYSDAVVGINEIDISSYGVGNHDFKSYERKNKIVNIRVVNPGQNYRNRKIKISPVGINTYNDSIFAKNHGYSSGEIITYNSYGTPISGLTTGLYYVTKIDDNNFKLSTIGSGNTSSNFYYSNQIYSKFSSSGIGTHEFNYPPISVSISGLIGVSTLTQQNYNAVLQPIFRGEIRSVFLESAGIGYGSSEILNYNKQASVRLDSGSSAQVIPVISNGRIQEILVQSSGLNYNSPPTISISGGIGISSSFNLTPIIDNGSLTEVKVVNGGSNFIQGQVSATVISSGSGAKFETKIKKWTVNLVERLIDQIGDDDGIIDEGVNSSYELQYCHLYAPRKLRQLVFGSKVVFGSLTYIPDLSLSNDKETISDAHSPIIGWAYDGNPIYGPYGYSSKTGGLVKALKSGYALLDSSTNRPTNFPNGFFVEDYIFVGDGDLDEYNGRFCITPEFPNGVYAYFSTINDSSVESSGIFKNYRKPVFPYFIGNYYKSLPISGNFDAESNQDNIDLLKTDLLRNTNPYGLNQNNSSYDFIIQPDKIQKQLTKIKSVSSSEIDYLKIITGGQNYKVDDRIIFDNKDTGGSGASAKVYSIKGKDVKLISVDTLELYGVEFANNSNNFIGFAISSHNLINNDIIAISGLSTYNSYLNSQFIVGIQSSILFLSNDITSQSNTGIVTYFNVYGNLDYPNIRENDVYQIESEKIKILSVDKKSSRIKVLRGYLGTVGVAHTASNSLIELSRKFNFNINSRSLETSAKVNKQLYFDPSESLGLGTDSNGRYTLSFANPGAGTSSLTVPTKTIYLPDHNLQTGDQIVYNTNGGSPVSISTNGIVISTLNDNDILYAARITDSLFGLSQSKVGLGSTGNYIGINSSVVSNTLYFSGIGTGVIHSLTTNYSNKISGKVSRNKVTVSTASTHGLSLQDSVTIKCISGITTSYKVVYNDESRRLVINPINFLSGAVNTTSNTITINDHGYTTGQAIIYSATIPSVGLINNRIYYIIAIDNNNFQLAENYYNSTLEYPIVIDITTASAGTISLVNPLIRIIENQTVVFDLSDSSLSYTLNSNLYSAFDFNLYLDKSYKNYFDSSSLNSSFEVVKSGRIGIDSTAKLTFQTSNYVPRVLYYNLSPLKNKDNLEVKKQIISDSKNVINNNELNIIFSKYTQTTNVSGIGSTTFSYTITEKPEKSSYTNAEANITYNTTSHSANGEIYGVQLISPGRSYKKLPIVSSISSIDGKNAILRTYGKNVGSIKNIQIEDIGFGYSVDKTIRPTAKIPQIFRVDPLFAFDKIGITSTGQKYITAPNLLVIDGYTNKIVDDILLEYKIGDTKVNIIKNTKNLTNTAPRIIPLNNSNGIRINSISYNNTTKDVTLQLITNYSNLLDFPFNVGDEIFVENTSIGITSTAKGYNSSAYDYAYFKLNAVNANVGGSNATITYNLSDYLTNGENPGTFQPLLSSGSVVRKSDQPIFNSVLKRNEFLIGETVSVGNASGIVRSWDSKNQLLKISSSDEFIYDQKLIGESSDSRSLIVEIYRFDSIFDVSSSSIVRNGWNNDKGFLNNSVYRIHDNDYYQYLSYSLKSKIPYETWSNPVNTLNHTAGFKKFSDLIVESKPLEFVGILTSQDNGYFSSVADLVSNVNLNSVADFDLAYEKTLNISGSIVSDEILFNSTIIQDYFESIGNRVLVIDDIGSQFNSNPRNIEYSVVDNFLSEDYRIKKYITLAKDVAYPTEKQISILTILTDGTDAYLNQYAKNDTLSDLGSFDYRIFGNQGNILFYPNKLYINNYNISLFSIDIQNNITGIGTTNLGGAVKIDSTNSNIPSGTSSPITLVGIASTYRSSKVLVEIHTTDNLYCQYSELNIIHNGTDVQLVEYGQLNNNPLTTSGLGTYNAYISGSNIFVDLIPNVSIAKSCIANTVKISIANTSSIGVGTYTLNSGLIDSSIVSIASSNSPIKNKISGYSYPYEGSYYIVSIEDKTNNNYQMSEILITDNQSETFIVNYGEVYTNSGLGTFGADISGNNINLMFTPNPNIDVDVRVYQNSIKLITEYSALKEKLNLNNFIYRSSSGFYRGTFVDVKREFELTSNQNPIFIKSINASDPNIIRLSENIIKIPNHFFVTGEKLNYSYSLGYSPIGITTTNIVGIGTTSILPPNVYAIKVNDSSIRLAASASDALKTIPIPLTLSSLGIGTGHYLKSNDANNRVLITVDNIIQSPIVATAITTTAASYIDFVSNAIEVSGFTSFFGSDLIKIDDEIMKINAVGTAGTNILSVERPWMGTGIQTHSAGSVIQKISGDYNIVGNTINFYTSPSGEVPLGTSTNSPNEIDYVGIATRSSFGGRVFLRSSAPNTSDEPYATNYIFDDISSGFNGITTQFNLKVNKNNILGISSSNPIVLINQIVQSPQRNTSPIYINGDYSLTENVGITSVKFTGNPVSVNNDAKTSNVPVGGIIVSVASTNGFGYQPLVSAGGTAIVSVAGTIQSISIGNSGSGYRSGIQTVNVGIATSTVYSRIIEYIGTASISNGSIVGVSITNPGVGYTSTNPPIVIFDSPLSYSNLPLIYSKSSVSGIGTGSKVNVVVGQGSSVINFEIINYGYAYGIGEKLTVSVGGTVGIPTTSSAAFNEFQVTIDQIQTDKFFGLNVGDFEILDPLDNLFNGKRTSFPIKANSLQKTIRAKTGSSIDVKTTLLVFINDILQQPDYSYTFNGGSVISFSEAPKEGDISKILFYKGTSSVDISEINILETIKTGDTLRFESDTLGLDESERTVININSSDSVKTLVYTGSGISEDEKLLRPIVWTRQTEDIFVDGKPVTKDREIYESNIQPYSRIIQSVGIGSTVIFVDNLRTFFENSRENATGTYNSKLKLISTDNLVSAAATAIVSIAGTITSISISDGGQNYTQAPEVIIQNPVGLGTTQRATVTASITNGIVTSISVNYSGVGYTSTNPPSILIAPPKPIVEILNSSSYSGDFGIISGISTTSVGVASTGLVFDIFVPMDSFLRKQSVVGTAVTISGIQTNYYFVVYNSNVGKGVTSLQSNGSIVSVGNTFIDNVYQVASVSIAQTSVAGVGLTNVARVTTSVSSYNQLTGIGFSGFFGEFSWGRISAPNRSNPKEFNIYTNGLTGISTSPLIERVNPLRYVGYTTSII
jgi:hypothetical protein